MTSRQQEPAGLVGVGYEGRTIEELIAQLHALGVSRLVDIRLNPLSRKPGLSKTALVLQRHLSLFFNLCVAYGR
ncbi:MAG TPA: DUF488 domain-containing protein [Micromonosporaceae bacterium]|nr:DUF488 domain-containing protein [Micromonosporaceae bacterium]